MKKVSVVIVGYNSLQFLPACIDSVRDQTYEDIELLIIDNNSRNGLVDVLKQTYPDVKIFENKENLGFAKAHNQGIRLSDGNYYMPLNPDVVLTENYVEKMVRAIELREDVGRVSGKLYLMEKDGTKTRRIYTTGHVIRRNGYATNAAYGEEDANRGDELIREVFGANGAACLYRREMLEDIKIGEGEYFDELFFMYGTDIDLDWRAQLLGWKCLYTPGAIGYHVGGGAEGLTQRKIQIEYIRRRYIMVLKNAFGVDIVSYYFPMTMKDFFFALRNREEMTIRAIAGLIPLLPDILRKRHQIMKKKKVSRGYINQWFQQ